MSDAKISPILQFVLLIVPSVMTGFYLVYSLVGLLLDGRDKANWALEAISVSVPVGGSIALFSVLVLLYARWKGLAGMHLLKVSGWAHLVLSIVLTIAVFIIVRY